VLERGHLAFRASPEKAVDYYLSAGHASDGERTWAVDEVPAESAPFRPLALRIRDPKGRVAETIRSTEPALIEFEYDLTAPVTGLRVGFYLNTSRAESVFTSFDTDDPRLFEKYTERRAGHYISRCTIPPDTLNAGRYSLGVNASSYRIRRYFADEQALEFSVDAAGAPGMHWPEPRPGVTRPRLEWTIETR
jgi:lipopolysaccharide transport system ATP-binding protein